MSRNRFLCVIHWEEKHGRGSFDLLTELLNSEPTQRRVAAFFREPPSRVCEIIGSCFSHIYVPLPEIQDAKDTLEQNRRTEYDRARHQFKLLHLRTSRIPTEADIRTDIPNPLESTLRSEIYEHEDRGVL